MKRYRILVVDDEPDLANMFKRTLERSEFDVNAFNDPFAALAHFKADMYDLLLIDIKMPKMSGFELYKKMMEIDSRPKVCFITAFVTYYDEFRKLYPSMNVNCFLRKPIAGKDLIQQIKLQLDPTVPEREE
jgi:two-component system, OmpR family, response regulator ChvI